MKYHILFNPHAGNGSGEARARALAEQYEEEAVCLDMTALHSYADFFASCSPSDAIVLCGGDGTLNRFINETDGLELPCQILYDAVGTGNDFLKDLPEAGDNRPIAIDRYIRDLPFVEVNGKKYRFLNGIGFGIDGYCCEVGDRLKEQNAKHINYTSIAVRGLLFHFKPVNATVTVDGQSFRYQKVWIAPTMNGRFYGGGMMVAPKQERLNEKNEVSLVLLHGTGKLKTVCIFPSIFKGEHLRYTNHVVTHVGKDISVTFDRPTALQIDGETLRNVTSYRVTVPKHAPLNSTSV